MCQELSHLDKPEALLNKAQRMAIRAEFKNYLAYRAKHPEMAFSGEVYRYQSGDTKASIVSWMEHMQSSETLPSLIDTHIPDDGCSQKEVLELAPAGGVMDAIPIDTVTNVLSIAAGIFLMRALQQGNQAQHRQRSGQEQQAPVIQEDQQLTATTTATEKDKKKKKKSRS